MANPVDVVQGVKFIGEGLGRTAKSVFVTLLAFSVALIMIGAIQREGSEISYRWSVKDFIEDVQDIFSSFPIPQTALDYITWTTDVIGWFITLWTRLGYAGWIEDTGFDGSVGAVPVL